MLIFWRDLKSGELRIAWWFVLLLWRIFPFYGHSWTSVSVFRFKKSKFKIRTSLVAVSVSLYLHKCFVSIKLFGHFPHRSKHKGTFPSHRWWSTNGVESYRMIHRIHWAWSHHNSIYSGLNITGTRRSLVGFLKDEGFQARLTELLLQVKKDGRLRWLFRIVWIRPWSLPNNLINKLFAPVTAWNCL